MTAPDGSPLKILMLGGLVPWHPPIGGSRVVPYHLAEALGEAGHRVDYWAVAPGDSRRDLEHARAVYVSLEPGSVAFPNSLVFPLYQYLKTRAELEQYDIVHCEALNAAFYVLHRATSGGPKVVVAEYRSGRPRFFWQRRSPFEPYLYLSLRLADLVVCPSDYSRRNVSQAYGAALSKTRALHGGVDSSFLSQDRKHGRNRQFSLVFCGRLNGDRRPFKTVDILLKAMPRVLDRHEAELKIIGTGERLGEYAGLAQTLGIEKDVRFLGFVDQSKLAEHYASADLFILPSRMENFPLVLLEAMASGLPVVATEVGGVPEAVEDGETGLLVPPYDAPALAEAINALLDDPNRMREMGARGRERVREHFTWEKTAERVAGYYREILQRADAPSEGSPT